MWSEMFMALFIIINYKEDIVAMHGFCLAYYLFMYIHMIYC